jgi:hypothetical protein
MLHLLKRFVSSIHLHQPQRDAKMSNSSNTNPQLPKKRLSPELAEVLHMLKSLETQPTAKPAGSSIR